MANSDEKLNKDILEEFVTLYVDKEEIHLDKTLNENLNQHFNK
jgi:predicted solute-binding protein